MYNQMYDALSVHVHVQAFLQCFLPFCKSSYCRFSLFQLSRNHISVVFFSLQHYSACHIAARFDYSIFTPFLSHRNTITLNGDLTVVEHSHLIERHFNCSITNDSSFLSKYYKFKDNRRRKNHPKTTICFKCCNFG